VVAEIGLPPAGQEWRSAMRQRAISARQVLLGHQWAAVLMESRLSQSPVRLNYSNSVLGLLRDGGFTTPMALIVVVTPTLVDEDRPCWRPRERSRKSPDRAQCPAASKMPPRIGSIFEDS
jgi:hypothetical protein